MGMVKSSVRTRLQQEPSLAELFTDVNRAIHPLRKSGMFVTVAALRFSGQQDLEFTVAGHLPILRYSQASGAVAELQVRQFPLATQGDTVYGGHRTEYGPGDIFVILTDGITEVAGADGEQLGIASIAGILGESAALPAREIFERIIQRAGDHGPQQDDQTLLVIRSLAD
jgi:serine phosphatase RsbU (regulator of sigma subunit)